jgi:hypothetical protein
MLDCEPKMTFCLCQKYKNGWQWEYNGELIEAVFYGQTSCICHFAPMPSPAPIIPHSWLCNKWASDAVRARVR